MGGVDGGEPAEGFAEEISELEEAESAEDTEIHVLVEERSSDKIDTFLLEDPLRAVEAKIGEH